MGSLGEASLKPAPTGLSKILIQVKFARSEGLGIWRNIAGPNCKCWYPGTDSLSKHAWLCEMVTTGEERPICTPGW